MEVLDAIPVELDPETVLKQLHLTSGKYVEEVQELIKTAHSVIHPKAIYEVSYVDSRSDDSVEIDGVSFTSRVLRINLEKIERVFPYIMTIGKELEDTANSFSDLVKRYCLETIGNITIDSIGTYFEGFLKRRYRLEKISEMNPGSLEDWPITQQEQLFSLFGNVKDLIGVELTDSLLMIPRKSASGIYFPTEVTFYSCLLCPRKKCEERQAPYDKSLEEKYGLVKSTGA
ncbi:MAG: vitamin B12 dependent methionine synthase [Candidatus Bathyarchaeota archaeon]|nr:MAG: vitamin B12 dependent methionine synthase [Candidatus Bathyarchaeota archaeon]